jgi:hypothetical protein
MGLFAHIEDNIVTKLVIAETAEWCQQHVSDGLWIESFEENTPRKHCGIGWIYYEELDNFSEPKPFESWTLDEETMTWNPPILKPEGPYSYWDEETLNWIQV